MSRRQSRRGRRRGSVTGRPSTELQREIVEEAHALYPHHFDTAVHGGCVGFTACTIVAAERRGIKLLPQAGSTEWRCVSPACDPGYGMTHFGYRFEGFDHPDVMRSIMEVRLPELHCWATDVNRRHVIDVTTRYFPLQARLTTGFDRPWTAQQPPEWLWRKAARMTREGGDSFYEADKEATAFVAMNFIAPAIEAIKRGERYEPLPVLIIPRLH